MGSLTDKNSRTESKSKFSFAAFFIRYGRLILLLSAALIHGVLFLFITLDIMPGQKREDTTIFKMIDVTEYQSPPPEEKKEERKEVVEVEKQDTVSEEVIETDKEVVEVEDNFLPQSKISAKPVIPSNNVRQRIVYPTLANKQGIEGIVYLELYIDKTGVIKKIKVLKDPGYGFAQAAINALEGIKCQPALQNGVPVAVKFRYPVKFQLKY